MKKISSGLILLLAASPALAHHPLAGMPMETFTHGMLSGVGHPLLGFDHLFFVALAGIAAVFSRRDLLAPLAYIAAMVVGCLVSSLWTSVPASELMIAISLLVLGGMLLSGRQFDLSTVLLALVSFGIFHGAAFGESLASQEAGFGAQVLTGYLLGLGITQYVIAIAAGRVCASLWNVSRTNAIQPRLAGAMVAGAGLYLTLEHFESSLLRALSS